MAKNDMYVVMYRIIAYLYACMKRGEEPDSPKWDSTAMGIPEPYWVQIIDQLVSHNYITGVEVSHTFNGTQVLPLHPSVTMEGVAFIQENSMMGKARKYLDDAKIVVPFLPL